MRYIDLTAPLKTGMRGVETEQAKDIKKDGWNASTFHLYSHCGTHMDAPLHFDVNDTSISDLPVERFFTECWVVQCITKTEQKQLTVESLGDVRHQFRSGQGLLFHTGWDRHIGSSKFRNGLPRISEELAEWCVNHKVSFIGVEPPSIADVNNIDELTTRHKTLLEAGIVIVEGLINLDSIKAPKVQVVALPLNVKGADGAPARVIALEQEQPHYDSWNYVGSF